MRRPYLYLSGYLEAHRDEYYAHLLAVSRDDEWTGWCVFFLKGVIEQANSDGDKARAIGSLYRERLDWIVQATGSQFAVRALEWMFRRPVFNATDFKRSANIPRDSAERILSISRAGGMLRQVRAARGTRSAIYALPELLALVEGDSVLAPNI